MSSSGHIRYQVLDHHHHFNILHFPPVSRSSFIIIPKRILDDSIVQVELLEKAKRKNIIVYLGTGSGKTFIAVMLIRHMRDLVMRGKKVVFLCNNVALLEQQAKVIASTTGLETKSYCGAQGKFIFFWQENPFSLHLLSTRLAYLRYIAQEFGIWF